MSDFYHHDLTFTTMTWSLLIHFYGPSFLRTWIWQSRSWKWSTSSQMSSSCLPRRSMMRKTMGWAWDSWLEWCYQPRLSLFFELWLLVLLKNVQVHCSIWANFLLKWMFIVWYFVQSIFLCFVRALFCTYVSNPRFKYKCRSSMLLIFISWHIVRVLRYCKLSKVRLEHWSLCSASCKFCKSQQAELEHSNLTLF